MNEENNLSLNIQTRILPQIEGAEAFEQQLNQLPNRYQQRLGEVITSPGFQQGLTGAQIDDTQQWLQYSQGLYEPVQNQIQELMKDLQVDLSTGRLTEGQKNKYRRKIERLKYDVGDLSPDIMEDAKDFMGELDPDRLAVMSGALKQARSDIEEDIVSLKEKFEDLAGAINNSNTEAQSFFQELKQAGVFAIGGMVVNEAMRWVKTGAEIEAKEKTAFDLTSPLGMYSERRSYEVFESVRERERLYSSIGMAVGGVIGGLVAGPFGALGGGIFGQQIGSQVAGIFNIGEQAELEEEMKFLNQSYGTLSGFVNSSQGYDIMRARLRARAGGDAIGRSGLGYTPEQELSMRLSFSDALGRFDDDLYREQTVFGRATGIDPSQLYSLNVSGRVTGADFGIEGLAQARSLTETMFGQDISSQRLVEVLNEIKLINEQMLRLNINADAREAIRFAQLPTQLFGTDNPYGRLGDLGGTTLKLMENLMQPRSGAHEAFLFQALGNENVMDFTEMMKGGIYSSDNMIKVMQMLRGTAGDDKMLSYFMLNEMMPGAPQGFIPQIADIVSDETKFNDLMKKLKEQEEQIRSSTMTEKEKEEAIKKAKDTLLGYEDMAKKNISATESMNKRVRDLQLEAAQKWRGTVYDISIKMAEFWSDMGDNAKVHSELVSKIQIGFDKLYEWLGGKGLLPEDEQYDYDLMEKFGIKDRNKLNDFKKGVLDSEQLIRDKMDEYREEYPEANEKELRYRILRDYRLMDWRGTGEEKEELKKRDTSFFSPDGSNFDGAESTPDSVTVRGKSQPIVKIEFHNVSSEAAQIIQNSHIVYSESYG